MVDKNIPWPTINDQTSEFVNVPLIENYKFKDMWYLDTEQAKPLFEKQADIIIQKQCKGIVDVGCRHGPVNAILHEKGYTDYRYMGFDTSVEPIELAKQQWIQFPNIEYRNVSWNDKSKITVDFDVDQVIWSGVLIYQPDEHHQVFHDITVDLYKSKNAIIAEVYHDQKYKEDRLLLNTITHEMDQYSQRYSQVDQTLLDCEIFSGRRLVLDITI
jgi:trans-aconitate methyltransferase